MGAKNFFILLLILLVACEPALQTVPTAQHETPVEPSTQTELVDACANITCASGQICQAGSCVCPSGKKLCGKTCIATSNCCTDSDCDGGSCTKGACSSAQECSYGQESKKGECVCASDKTFCKEQDKCIDRNACCVHSQCDNFERCVETNWRTSFCIKTDEKKVCKILADHDRSEVFAVKDNDYRVKATGWWDDGGVTFDFNNQTIRLQENVTMMQGNATIFQEGIQVTGGFCKEDTQD